MARATASTTAPTTRRAARPKPAARAELEVVAPRGRITPAAMMFAAMFVAVAFGALSVQISLIHRQQQLDGIRAEITEVQMANKELRQTESRLQAPAEILRIARDELGMVESKPPELVTPAVQTVGAATTAGTVDPATDVAAPGADG